MEPALFSIVTVVLYLNFSVINIFNLNTDDKCRAPACPIKIHLFLKHQLVEFILKVQLPVPA